MRPRASRAGALRQGRGSGQRPAEPLHHAELRPAPAAVDARHPHAHAVGVPLDFVDAFEPRLGRIALEGDDDALRARGLAAEGEEARLEPHAVLGAARDPEGEEPRATQVVGGNVLGAHALLERRSSGMAREHVAGFWLQPGRHRCRRG